MVDAHQDELQSLELANEGKVADPAPLDAVTRDNVDYHEDRLALEALLMSVPMEIVSSLVDKDTTRDAWDTIALLCVGVDHAQKAMVQKLRQEWDCLAFKSGEDVDDFALHLFGLVR